MSNTADPAPTVPPGAGSSQRGIDARPSLSRGLTFLLAVTVAVAVGNLYYLHPLMGTIARSFQVPESTLGIAASLAQIGQTLGMLFLLPLGDIYDRRRLIPLRLPSFFCSAPFSSSARRLSPRISRCPMRRAWLHLASAAKWSAR
jgi:predicted MFS family arabinose efflux permease